LHAAGQRIAAAEKGFEDSLFDPLGHAGPAIQNRDTEHVAFDPRGERNFLRVGTVFLRVGNQVYQDLREGVLIADDRIRSFIGSPLHGEAGFPQPVALGFPNAFDHRAGIGRPHIVRLALPLDSREIEDVVDESGETLAFADNDAQVTAALLGFLHSILGKQFRKHSNGGQRSLQLV
jgi:hypothetical protein